MYKNLLKSTLRSLLKNKGFAYLNIIGLSIGIASAALIFLWVEDELTYNQYFKNRQHIYLIKNHQTYDDKTFTFDPSPGPLGPALQSELPGIRHTARTSWSSKKLFSSGEKKINETGIFADSSFFLMFDLRFHHPVPPGVFQHPQSLVISRQMARRFFGTEEPVGQSIRFNNEADFIIQGVFEDLPPNVSFQVDWIAPFAFYAKGAQWLTNWKSNGILTYVELEPTADVPALNKKLLGFIQSKDAAADVSKPFLFPMEKWRLYNKWENGKEAGGRIKYVNLFITIAWIVLLIACINFMNLATAKSGMRAKEVGVRKVIGAGKRSLVLQFIFESLFLSFMATLLALGLVWVALPSFNTLVEKALRLSLFEPMHALFFLAIALLCGLLAGSYPAFYLSSFKPIIVLKGLKIKTGASAIQIRKGLVIAQFTLSIIFTIATLLIYQQVQHVKQRELGYAKNQLVYVRADGNIKAHFPAIKNDLQALGSIENATLSNNTILNLGNNTGNFRWKGKEEGKEVLITVESVSPEYIATMGLSLKAGRDFQPNLKTDSSHVIINETLANIMGQNEIIGSSIAQEGGSSYTVIGVVKDHLYNNVYASPAPLILFADTANANVLTLKLKNTQDLEEALNKARPVISQYNPAHPVEFKFVDEDFGKFFKSELLVGKLSGIFSFLAIFISCLGLFALAAYTAEQRTKEIGIRKVLGASTSLLAGLISKEFLRLVIIACLIAFPIAWWYMYRWLQDFEYRIAIPLWVFMAAGSAAFLIAVVTVSFHAIRVAMANPIKSLRAE